MSHHVNQFHGLAFELLVAQTPIEANPSAAIGAGCFAYIKNLDVLPITLLEIRVWVESPEYIDIYINDVGTPVEGATMTPINMNFGSGNHAIGTFLTGNDITGLTKGILIDRLRVAADDNDHIFKWPSNFIIPRNNILTLYAGVGGIPIEASIQFYYHGKI